MGSVKQVRLRSRSLGSLCVRMCSSHLSISWLAEIPSNSEEIGEILKSLRFSIVVTTLSLATHRLNQEANSKRFSVSAGRIQRTVLQVRGHLATPLIFHSAERP